MSRVMPGALRVGVGTTLADRPAPSDSSLQGGDRWITETGPILSTLVRGLAGVRSWIDSLPNGGSLATTFAALPNPDVLPIGTMVTITDETSEALLVCLRPNLEADGSQRNYYRPFRNGGFEWKPVSAAPVVAAHLGYIDPGTGLLSPITALAQVPNCMIGTTLGAGVPVACQRLGSPAISLVAAVPPQSFVPGQNLTWNASGELIGWTIASPTLPVGFITIGADWPMPFPGTSLGLSFVGFLPFIEP